MADDFAAQLGRFQADLAKELRAVPRAAGQEVARMGKQEVLRVAVSAFGADRRFSGARQSRKAKGVARATARIFQARTEIYPSGDPFYIFMKGRGGGKRIMPIRGRAVLTPGGYRARSRVGRLAPREELLDPAERAIQRRAPKIISDAVDVAIVKAVT